MAQRASFMLLGLRFRQRSFSRRAGNGRYFGGFALAFVLHLIGIGGWVLALLCIAMFVWGIRICGYTEKELGIQDYGGIVWDEIVAMILVLSFVPFRWGWWLAAFIVFRMFDISAFLGKEETLHRLHKAIEVLG